MRARRGAAATALAASSLTLAACAGGSIAQGTPASNGQSFVSGDGGTTIFRGSSAPQAPPVTGLSAHDRERFIQEMAELPARLRAVVEGLTDAQLDTPYREGGWTVRQVVHHVPDSHLQGYARFKLALSEDEPTIKTYEQAAWGEFADTTAAPVAWSLDLLEALHKRWVYFIRSLAEEDFGRTYCHPELGVLDLEKTLQLYAWHGRHHLAHVKVVANRV